MKKTNAQRQANWRAKQRIKATMFDLSDQGRRLGVWQCKSGTSPEWRVIREYFLAYPGCHRLPVDVGCGLDGKRENETSPVVYALMDYDFNTEIEARVALIALSSITSNRVAVEAYSGGKGTAWRDDKETQRIRAEIDEMKRAGLWRPFVGELPRLGVMVAE